MGWRDINMNRRRPPLRLAVVPLEQGQDPRDAVLQKAARSACAGLSAAPSGEPSLLPFVAGFLAGFARHQALRHGVDAEEGGTPMQGLLAALVEQAPQDIADRLAELHFLPRRGPLHSHRASLRADQGPADAGYLAGHLASLCGSQTLLKSAVTHLSGGDVEAFLTACDSAADRLQTHQPTMAIRFDMEERAILRAALE